MSPIIWDVILFNYFIVFKYLTEPFNILILRNVLCVNFVTVICNYAVNSSILWTYAHLTNISNILIVLSVA